MPYPVHNRLVVRGKFNATPEIWSYSLKFNSQIPVGFDVKPQDWNASAVTAAINAFHNTAQFGSSTEVWGWRGYQIGSDGNLIGNNLKIVEYSSAVAGTSANILPTQVACVVSLQADDRGPARLGRAFLPGPASNLSTSDRRITVAYTTALLSTFKTMIEALKNAMYTDPLIIGESLVNVSPSGSGVMQNVTKYRCGRVYDTVRTRRNKMLEDYQELSA